MKLSYLMLLQVSADSPKQLRACDVDRAMEEAHHQREAEGFRTWLLANELKEDTRAKVTEWFHIDPDCDMCHGEGEVKVWPKAQIDFNDPQQAEYFPCTKCKEGAAG